MSPTTMPAVFIGHGSPMNTIEDNRYTAAWRALGARIPRPRAIVAVSAHWYVDGTAVTAMPAPRTIHDFTGFPPELFAVQYPAPGHPALAAAVAAEVAQVARTDDVRLDDRWGLDHGTWSVLAHMFPDADVPVVQLSIDAHSTLDQHIAIGAALAPLRDDGVLVVGSGNVVHNLRAIDWGRPDEGFDWAHDLDDATRDVMTRTPGDLGRLHRRPSFAHGVPTPDHFLPLAYLAGLATAAGSTAEVLVDGYAFGSLSMTSYVVT